MSSHEDLKNIALTEFAIAGYNATSLQRIAELAGLSKSSVLYHYHSKEALLEAAISPAIARMDALIGGIEGAPLTLELRSQFVVAFVDFLLLHRLEVHMFINQCQSLVDVPIVERAGDIVRRIATYFSSMVDSTEDRMRFGVALGGAAYTLVTAQTFGLDERERPVDEIRAALITIISELLRPVSPRTPASDRSASDIPASES